MSEEHSELRRFNLAAAAKLTVFALVMLTFGYALVPLYEKICEVAGINNLLNPQRVDHLTTDVNRKLRLEFDVNARGLVSMKPNTVLMKDVHPGKTYSVIYTLENLSGKPLLAQAVPSYGPPRAGKWFRKTHCFCFDQITMAAGEVRQEPVVFVVDPSMPNDISTIALSYTFFEIEGGRAALSYENSAAISIAAIRVQVLEELEIESADVLQSFVSVKF